MIFKENGREFVPESILFDCTSGQWSISYTVRDNLTKLEGSKNYTFDRISFAEMTTPKDVFDRLISLYKDSKIIK